MAVEPTKLKNEWADLFEHPLCGFLITEPGGKIIRANETIAEWTGSTKEELQQKRFSDLLTMGGKIYYETHLGPLLRMRGFFDEVAVELHTKEGEKKQVLINAFERRDTEGSPLEIQVTVFRAADRRLYEQNLKTEKVIAEQNFRNEQILSNTREQFIAVLGHDLRNPLSSIVTGTSLLLDEPDIAPHKPILDIISRSAARMSELINNIMDFARARMGSGILIFRKPTELEPILRHVVDELSIVWPHRSIQASFDMSREIHCDGSRIAQLCSNLLANALTHGSTDSPIFVRALNKDNVFELSVSNAGKPIPPSAIEIIFHPFTREDHRPSQQGLGLGLFIASEIAKAHHGELNVLSDEMETRFTLRFES